MEFAGRFWLIAAGALALIAMLFLVFYQPKGWKKTALGGALAAFLLFSLWYHMPIVCRDAVMAEEMIDGQVGIIGEQMIRAELVIRRSFFHKPTVSGWVETPHDIYADSLSNYSYNYQDRNVMGACLYSYARASVLDPEGRAYIRISFDWRYRHIKYLHIDEFLQEDITYFYTYDPARAE